MKSTRRSVPVGCPAREIAHRFISGNSISVSPDGQHLLFLGERPNPASRTPTIVCDLPDCTNQREVPWHSGQWTPDGQGIAYIDASVDAANIQVQAIAGGPPRPLTHFTDKQIDEFAWSPNGKRLAIARSTRTADIVLINGFGGPQ
jgi:Tol biopolymer transport system component